MKKLSTSLSVLFTVLCILSFRFVEPAVHTSGPDGTTTSGNTEVCESATYEYFYTSSARYKAFSDTLYAKLFDENNRPDRKVFQYALKGYAAMLSNNLLIKKNILAFVDYSISANHRRFWVLDLRQMKVLYHELVAHGRNTGEEYARKFSNKENSFQSSLGFFVTGEIYNGKHELSVKLNGVERNFNGKAFDRGIVIHGADYVSEDYIRQNKRLGRSLGCPAVSQDVIGSLSSVISDGACLFLYYPHRTYIRNSRVLNTDVVFASPSVPGSL